MASSSRGGLTDYVELVRRNRNFRSLWTGEIISLLGDWFNLIASASLIATLTQSGLAIGGLFVVRMLAPFLVSPIAGVVADRYDRRKVLIATDIGRAIIVMGFLLVQAAEQVWLLYVLTALQLGLSGFFVPTRNAILPNIVTDKELGAANALGSATWSVMLALGAALGGLAAGQFGVYPSFIIDSLTFVFSAFLISRITYHHDTAETTTDSSIGAAFQQYIDGLRYLRDHIDTLFTTLLKPANSLLVSGGFQVIQVMLAEQIFPIGQGGGTSLGLLYASVGVGTGLGPIFARMITGDRLRTQRIAIAFSYTISFVGLLMTSTLANFTVVMIGTFLRGVGIGIAWVFSAQILLATVPNQVRGRVFSTEFALVTLGNAASAGLAGWAQDQAVISVEDMLFWMGLLVIIPGVLWGLWTFLGKNHATPIERTSAPQDEPSLA